MGRMLRPRVTVVPESAVVPDRNRIDPPPDHFTHEVAADQPYYYAEPAKGARRAGTFAAGTKVLLLARPGGGWCRVADGRGLHVVTAAAGLQPLG